MTNFLSRFLRDESGASAIEYCLLAAGVAVVIAGAATTLGQALQTQLGDDAAKVGAG
jgi:pilus assembly protein Flp/PilA